MRRSLPCVFVTCIVLSIAVAEFTVTAAAQNKEEMLQSLQKSKTRTRSMANNINQGELESFITKTRGLRIEERARILEITENEELPSLDLEIYFEYDSAKISSDSFSKLTILGEIMKDSSFSDSRFLVFGHTDAKGSNSYNLALSQRRAVAVQQFLSAHAGLNSSKLIAIGFGEEKLKLPNDPEAAVNRRVQIVRFEQ